MFVRASAPGSRRSRWLAIASLSPALLLAASAPAFSGAGEAPPSAKAPEPPFESNIRYFEEIDREVKGPRPRVVFVGSSSIRMWETLGADFPRHRVLNRGFGGSQISDSVRYADRIVVPHRPPLVVMYAGSNDIDAGKSPETVADDFKRFAALVWASLPTTSIAYISIAPNPARWSQVDRVREANRRIAAYCAGDKRLRFVDVFPLMLGPDGRPRRELFIEDGLHMNRKGYEVWIPLVRDAVEAVVPPAPDPPKAPGKARDGHRARS